MDEISQRNTYKKLFNIHYNNKIFTIFIDKYGRKTFLELPEDGKYRYPNIDDFIVLHKMYNQREPFIRYYSVGDRLSIHNPKTVTFKEYVIEKTGLFSLILTGAIALSSITTGVSYNLRINNGNLEIIPEYNSRYFDDARTLDNYLGTSSVSEKELIDAINNNPNLSDYVKEHAIMLAKHIKDKYPNTDNRIFYDNIKTLKSKELDDNVTNKHLAGCYNILSNNIKIKKEYAESDEVLLHELAHVYHHINSFGSIRTETIGESFNEAMTNKVIDGMILPTQDSNNETLDTHTYQREEKILDYLLTLVDYSYYDYEQGGINKLYNLLKSKYPEVDITYIFYFSDTMCQTQNSTGENIKIEESPEFLDCLFDLCTYNIDSYKNVYEPLINFLQLIDVDNYSIVAANYIEQYNNILKQLGYDQDILDIDKIYGLMNNYKSNKKSVELFDELLNHLNINDNVFNESRYNPLKLFLLGNDVTSNKTFCELLEKYNNFLLANGIPEENIKSVQEFLSKSQKYQNLNITGYVVASNGSAYLSVDVLEKDRVYNQKTRVAVLDKDGKINLLDVNDIELSEKIGNIQSIFNYYLLTNPKDDLNWYNDEFFEKECDVQFYDYRMVDITLDGNVVAHDYAGYYTLNIGVNEDGTNSFKLTSRKDGKVLYQEGNPVVEVPIRLSDYVKVSKYKNSLELNDLFNKNYLKKFALDNEQVGIKNKNYIHYNESNDKIICRQRPTAILDNNGNEILLKDIFISGTENNETNEIDVYLTVDNNRYYLFSKNDNRLAKITSLLDILRYYDLYDENKLPYKFSTDELINLFTNYLNDTLSIDNQILFNNDFNIRKQKN